MTQKIRTKFAPVYLYFDKFIPKLRRPGDRQKDNTG